MGPHAEAVGSIHYSMTIFSSREINRGKNQNQTSRSSSAMVHRPGKRNHLLLDG